MPAPNLPDLYPCLRPGTSPVADVCLPMTGWVAPACSKPVSKEGHSDITGDRFPPPPHIPATRGGLAAFGFVEGALCHLWCRLATPPPPPLLRHLPSCCLAACPVAWGEVSP